MGLLDALLGNDSGGGLLGGLPQSWQWQNPQYQGDSTKDFLEALKRGSAETADNTPVSQNPFGPVPQIAPPSVFGAVPQMGSGASMGSTGAAPGMPGPIPGMFTPPGASGPPPIQQPAQAPPPPAPAMSPQDTQSGPVNRMNVGGYQMPQFGSVADYTPTNSIPQNAQPTQGQLPPQAPGANAQTQGAPQVAQQLPPALGGGISALGRIGSPDGLIARLTGNDSRSIAQQNLRAQYEATRQALIANGIPERQANSTAMLSALNPEAAKTVLPELLTNKEKYQVISEDPLSGKHYGFVNDREQTINGKPIGQGGDVPGQSSGLQGMTDTISQMRTQGATKEQMLAQIPTGFRDDVASLLSGKAVPANMGRAQSRMALLTLAKTVDPTFDETQIPGRVKMRSDFMGEGKNGQAIGSFNTAQHHIDKLSDDLETVAKFQGNYPTINAIRRGLANQTNSNPALRDALQSMNIDMAAVNHEVGNAYNAGHLSDHDMATWNALTKSDLPPDQLRRGIADFVDLLNGKRDSLNHMYRQQFDEDAPSIEQGKNAAITAKVHQRSPQYGGTTTSGLPSGWTVKVR